MPKEVVLDLPKLTVYGSNQATVENYGGIIEYDEAHVRLKTNVKVISISGKNLELKTITDVDVLVEGDIDKIEYGRR